MIPADYQVALAERDLPWKQVEENLSIFKKSGHHFVPAIKYLETISQYYELPLFYFGGFLRDLYLGLEPRDIDIVFNKSSKPLFDSVAQEWSAQRNRFGGWKLNLAGISVDVWVAQDTNYFMAWPSPSAPAPQDRMPLLPSIHNVPKTTFFTVEGIVMEVYRKVDAEYPSSENPARLGWEHHFFNSCSRHIIEMQEYASASGIPVTPFPELQVVRAHHLHQKMPWRIGDNLKNFIRKYHACTSPERFREISLSHYKKDIDPLRLYEEIGALLH